MSTKEAFSSLTPQDLIALFENFRDAIFLVYLEGAASGKVAANNRMAESIFFYEPNEMLGQDVKQFALRGLSPRLIERLRAGESIDFNANYFKKDGSDLIAFVTASAIRLQDGLYILVSIRDVTSARNAFESLSFEQEKLKNILNGLNEGVLGIDLTGSIVFINRKIERILGLKYENSLYLNATPILKHIGLIQEDQGDIDAASFAKQGVRKSNSFLDQNYRYTTTSQSGVRSFEVSVSVITHARPSQTILVILFKDKTEEYYLEDQLRQVQKMQAVGQLVAGIAHDFNNVLGAIINSAQTLTLKDISGQQRKQMSELILASADTAANMIKRLLTFSTEKQLDLVPMNVEMIIRDTLSIFKIGQKVDIKLELFVEKSDLVYQILADAHEVQSAILNILINASNAIRGSGQIIIILKHEYITLGDVKKFILPVHEGNYICIKIQDNGIGIKAEDIDKIFEPYFSTNPSHKGVGLGLAMVYGTMKRHFGTVDVNSELGKGSCFCLYFPMYIPTVEAPKAPDLLEIKGRGNLNAHILLVGGDQANFAELSDALVERSCRIRIENSIVKALKYYKSYFKQIDFVIIDSILIDGTAFQCMSTLMSINSNAKVIIQGHQFSKDEVAVFSAKSALAVLNKPYSIRELFSLIETDLGTRKNTR